MVFAKSNLTFIPVIALYQYLKLQEEIFINHSFTLILWGITSQQDTLGTETAGLLQLDAIGRIIDVLLVGASPSSDF